MKSMISKSPDNDEKRHEAHPMKSMDGQCTVNDFAPLKSMIHCFVTACHEPVNHRGKFCEYHDRKERDAAAAVYAMFGIADGKKVK